MHLFLHVKYHISHVLARAEVNGIAVDVQVRVGLAFLALLGLLLGIIIGLPT